MKRWLVFTLCVALLMEYYSFMLVDSLVVNLPVFWDILFISFYALLTIFTWISISLLRKINWERIPPLIRDPFIALAMGLFISKLIILLVFLTDDVRRILLSFVTGYPLLTIERSELLRKVAVFAGSVSIAGFLFGMRRRYDYRVKKISLKLANLPEAFKGFRIVQLSDIHTGSFANHKAVAKGIEKAMIQKADIILFTGDLVNNRAIEVDNNYQEIFSRLKAPMGVFSILGNHDYGDYVEWINQEDKESNLQQLKTIQKKMGWQLLLNEHVLLEKGNDTIALIGVENWSAKSTFPQYGNMQKAYAGLAKQNISVKILLSHDPSHWETQVLKEYKDIDLTLSGHTHGMQLGIESKWLKWSPVQYFYKQWAGLYEQNNQYLYVNRGFGFLTYPGRIGIMPEITVIELV